MCGRFALFAPASKVAEVFGVEGLVETDLRPRYNIAPTQDVLAVFQEGDERKAAEFRWGLVPSWAKDKKIGYKLINARSETARKKPSFRSAFKRRRLLVPASGFYEWVRDGKKKLPYFIRTRGDAPFAIAGLWEQWTSPEGEEVKSLTLLTTGPNELMRSIHDRMPVILPESRWDEWLDPEQDDRDRLEELMEPYADEMEAWRVSTKVNNAHNQGEELAQPKPDDEE